jgi:hypothetical protein
MRSAALLPLLVALSSAPCQRADKPAVGQNTAEASEHTSDMPPRGVEPANPRTIAAPADAGPSPLAELGKNEPSDAGAGPPEDAPCHSDQDCDLTFIPKGGCCAMLCAGRAVTKVRAAQLAAEQALCPQRIGGPCPVPLCRPPIDQRSAACVQGRCAVHRTTQPDSRLQ